MTVGIDVLVSGWRIR